MTKLVVALAFLALNAYVYHFFATEEVTPPRMEFSGFPLSLEDWTCDAPETIDPAIIENLGLTDYLVCTFRHHDPDARVGVYLGYHASQVRRGGSGSAKTIHPPKHCLPGSGWNIMVNSRAHMELPGFPEGGALLNRFIIAHGNQREIVYYWYQSRGRIIAEDWQKIVALFWDRARIQRTDGALVRFTIPLRRADEGDIARADEAFRDLASQIVPLLPAFIPE